MDNYNPNIEAAGDFLAQGQTEKFIRSMLSEQDAYTMKTQTANELFAHASQGMSAEQLAAVDRIAASANRKIAAMTGTPPAPPFYLRYGVPIAIITLIATVGTWWVINSGNPEPSNALLTTVVEQEEDAPASDEPPVVTPAEHAPATEEAPTEEPTTALPAETEAATEELPEETTTPAEPVETTNPIVEEGAPEEAAANTEKANVPPPEEEKNKRTAPVKKNSTLRIFEAKIINKMSLPNTSKSRKSSKGPEIGKPVKNKKNKSNVLTDMPEYYGGGAALEQFIADNFRNAINDNEVLKNKTAIVQFVVTSKGKVKDIELLQSISKEADKEFLRLLEGMPDWKTTKNSFSIVCQMAITLN